MLWQNWIRNESSSWPELTSLAIVGGHERGYFAITLSRSSALTGESARNTLTAIRVPSGATRTPTSFVAAVTPFHAPLVPVLWEISHRCGTPALSRVGNVLHSFIACIRNFVDEAESSFPLDN